MLSAPEVAPALLPLEYWMFWKDSQLPEFTVMPLTTLTFVAALKLVIAGLGLHPPPSWMTRAWLVPFPITQGLAGATVLPHTVKVLAVAMPVTMASNLEEAVRAVLDGLFASNDNSTLLAASGFTEESPPRSYTTNATTAAVSSISAAARPGLEGRKCILWLGVGRMWEAG